MKERSYSIKRNRFNSPGIIIKEIERNSFDIIETFSNREKKAGYLKHSIIDIEVSHFHN